LGKALIVEDDALVAMVAQDHLLDLGFEPVWAERGGGALALLTEGDLAIVLIDIGLPDMRGDDLAKRARKAAPRLPIIMASGYDGEAIRATFASDEAVVVLAKPYSFADLRAAIISLGFAGARTLGLSPRALNP
jgi:DNA-binding response OmpR family regulator